VSQRRADFARDGFLVVKNYYDRARDISPITRGIRQIVELVASKHGLDVPCATPIEAITDGYTRLVAKNRQWGAHVYDAIKQIPAFMTLVAHPRNSELFEELRPQSIPGLAAGGYGIRIDIPGEERYRAPWHQEFPAQLRSADGVVFWSPLLALTQEMGPVEIAVGSHAEGFVPVHEDGGDAGKTGAYALRLDDEQRRLSRYRRIAPLTEPGDLVLLDFLTLHQSGQNLAAHPRWTMQFRYFNFADPVGIDIDWKGSFAAGENFAAIMPRLMARSGKSQ
jgi:ectoine hydroxylase-related dioxygenase (phytanoyl-CoA dioxygenase family)